MDLQFISYSITLSLSFTVYFQSCNNIDIYEEQIETIWSIVFFFPQISGVPILKLRPVLI